MKVRQQIVKADTVDQAHKLCVWATVFQRSKDWKQTNNWICKGYIKNT